MLSKTFCDSVRTQFACRASILKPVAKAIDDTLAVCAPEEAVLLQWYYATMPISDAGEYAPTLLLQMARHALMLREKAAWCAALPQAVFLRDVAYYRINSEKIEAYGPVFFKELYPMVREKSVKDAILAINDWCAQHVVYTSADQRTASPLTVYRAGCGRCGEESTFTVAALRSVGIAARQVYTPRWAHCDDNHAWVEAYADGAWCFFGACEPEEILNRGWFTAAASRALLIHARAFAPDVTEDAGECIGREGVTTFYNATPLYADTKLLQIRVVLADGTPAKHAELTLETLNMAEFCRIATLQTDENGCAQVQMGKGDVRVCATCGNCYAEAQCNAAETDFTLSLTQTHTALLQAQNGWQTLDITAPPATVRPHGIPTAQQQAENAQRLKNAAACRQKRARQNFDAEKAAALSPEAQALLHLSAGNFDEILTFLQKDDEPMRLALLHALTEKDLFDANAAVLEEHLQAALRCRSHVRLGSAADGSAVFGTAPDEIFVADILCPRAGFEELCAYRAVLANFFAAAQQAAFLKNPHTVWDFVQSTVEDAPALDYKTLTAFAPASLTMGYANKASQGVLFVCICRTFGIPARLNPVSKAPEYYENGIFMPVLQAEEKHGAATLHLTVDNAADFVYFKTWTLGRFDGKSFVTLDYTDLAFAVDGTLSLTLQPGIYRLITSARMPNGSQNAAVWVGNLADGESLSLTPTLRGGRLVEYLMKNPLESFNVTTQSGEVCDIRTLLQPRCNLIAFLDEGAEPTAHVLGELLEQQAAVREAGIAPLFVRRAGTAKISDKLQMVLQALSGAQVCTAPFERELETLARQMFVDHEKLPLLVVTGDGLCGRYACSGYNVGSVDLILKIARAIKTGDTQ
ncbi:MAG: transglutaminase domain-containing protein [Ruthenibacterium sp.]